jgi:hypothetical protein
MEKMLTMVGMHQKRASKRSVLTLDIQLFSSAQSKKFSPNSEDLASAGLEMRADPHGFRECLGTVVLPQLRQWMLGRKFV